MISKASEYGIRPAIYIAKKSLLDKKTDKSKLSTIVYIIDDDDIYKGGRLSLEKCTEQMSGPVHNKFKNY